MFLITSHRFNPAKKQVRHLEYFVSFFSLSNHVSTSLCKLNICLDFCVQKKVLGMAPNFWGYWDKNLNWALPICPPHATWAMILRIQIFASSGRSDGNGPLARYSDTTYGKFHLIYFKRLVHPQISVNFL